jgi:SAM-dependent methyltransferase
LVRLNLGSGPLQVPSGWIGLDASAHLLVRWLPEPLLRRLLARTSVGADAARSLKHGRFVFGDLRHGIPFADGTAEAVFTSHVLHHMTDEHGTRLIRECARVLVPGGVLRVVVPEVPEGTRAERAGRYLHSPRSRYSWPKLRAVLEEAGFGRVRRVAYRIGACPDIELLDNRPDSLFVEGVREPSPPLAARLHSAARDA